MECVPQLRSIWQLQRIFFNKLSPLYFLNITVPACGGPGQWTRIAHLDMSDPSQQCPSNWSLITTTVKGCGRSVSSGPVSESVTFASTGQSYSRVCGRVIAYQSGTPDAFFTSLSSSAPGLEGTYVDGVSLTHGAVGSRQHIWTFAACSFVRGHFCYIF